MRRGDGPEESIYANVGRIGNLILLPLGVNQEAKTRPFAEKKALYTRHNLRMVQEVCAKNDWTLAEIDEREEKIIRWAKTQWSDL